MDTPPPTRAAPRRPPPQTPLKSVNNERSQSAGSPQEISSSSFPASSPYSNLSKSETLLPTQHKLRPSAPSPSPPISVAPSSYSPSSSSSLSSSYSPSSTAAPFSYSSYSSSPSSAAPFSYMNFGAPSSAQRNSNNNNSNNKNNNSNERVKVLHKSSSVSSFLNSSGGPPSPLPPSREGRPNNTNNNNNRLAGLCLVGLSPSTSPASSSPPSPSSNSSSPSVSSSTPSSNTSSTPTARQTTQEVAFSAMRKGQKLLANRIVDIRILVFEKIEHPQHKKPPYVVYLMDVKADNDESWQVTRRYSEFRELEQELSKEKKYGKLPPLPSKLKLVGNTKELFVAKRAKKLQHFLDEILSKDDIASSEPLLRFVDPNENPPAAVIPNPDKNGFLWKKGLAGHRVKNWKKRWFVLHGNNLWYFTDQYAARPCGKVPLASCTFESVPSEEQDDSTCFFFQIYSWSQDRGYLIKTETEEEMQSWIKALRNKKINANVGVEEVEKRENEERTIVSVKQFAYSDDGDEEEEEGGGEEGNEETNKDKQKEKEEKKNEKEDSDSSTTKKVKLLKKDRPKSTNNKRKSQKNITNNRKTTFNPGGALTMRTASIGPRRSSIGDTNEAYSFDARTLRRFQGYLKEGKEQGEGNNNEENGAATAEEDRSGADERKKRLLAVSQGRYGNVFPMVPFRTGREQGSEEEYASTTPSSPSYGRQRNFTLESLDIQMDTTENIVMDGHAVVAASVSKLIEKLTDDNVTDIDFIQTFILTYHSFIQPMQLLRKLIALFLYAPPRIPTRAIIPGSGPSAPPHSPRETAASSSSSSSSSSDSKEAESDTNTTLSSSGKSITPRKVNVPPAPLPLPTTSTSEDQHSNQQTRKTAPPPATAAARKQTSQTPPTPPPLGAKPNRPLVVPPPLPLPSERLPSSSPPLSPSTASPSTSFSPSSSSSFSSVSLPLQQDAEQQQEPTTTTAFSSPASGVKDPSKIRVCTVLLNWLELSFRDFVEDPKLTDRLLRFIDQSLLTKPQWQNLAQKLKHSIKKKVFPKKRSKEAFLTAAPEPILPTLFDETSNAFDILDLSPLEVARQLTLLEFELFYKIQPKEFLSNGWSAGKNKETAPNIIVTIERFNKVSEWVTSTVVNAEELRLRAAVLTRFITIAEECVALNNLNAAMEITSGLGSAAVHRLSRTWELVPKEKVAVLEDMQEMLSTKSSYKVYRERLHTLNPPVVPYLGVYLTDITFIDDGNPDTRFNGLINWKKKVSLAKVVKEIQMYQQVKYCLHPVAPIQDYLWDIEKVTISKGPDEAFKQSLLREPREPSSSANSDKRSK
ncbi:pleckstriny domain-containing family H member 1-like isoform X2 [Balamuthia mandrillaris]